MSDLAKAVVDMGRAHERHQQNPSDRKVYACSGITDPLTRHWCQFTGTAQEHYVHVLERTSAALADALGGDA